MAASSFLLLVANPLLAQKIYWTERSDDKIQRANLDGSDREDVIIDLPLLVDIDIHPGQAMMYWTSEGRIRRSSLDGQSPIETLVSIGLITPEGIALDLADGKMYWTDTGTGKIQRANLDGSGVEDLVTSVDEPVDIALDPAANKMYWIALGVPKIQRANLDGSESEDLISEGLLMPRGIAIDASAGKVYWADTSTDTIHRANLDGSQAEDFLFTPQAPFRIVLDLHADKIYWGDPADSDIRRADLAGGPVEILLQTSSPFGVALDKCFADMDCDDGRSCDGVESCVEGSCQEADILNDCNANDVPDLCDVADGTSEDCNGNEIPDECETNVFHAESGELAPIGDGSPQSFTVFSPPFASTDVSITLTAVADLASQIEFLTVFLNGTELGVAFEANASDCPMTPDQEAISMFADEFNTIVGEGDALIEILASSAVNPALCESFVTVTLEYQAVDGGDCNDNDIPDVCEIDTDGDGLIDDCDLCPADNPDDADNDGVCDSEDLCMGDDATGDTDGDGVCDNLDICEGDDATGDSDNDGVCDSDDNCPKHANTDQADCDNDGVGDVCAIADGVSDDCNENAIPDECDIADGNSRDNNGNGIPDECDCPADLNGDGIVEAFDLAMLLGSWGECP